MSDLEWIGSPIVGEHDGGLNIEQDVRVGDIVAWESIRVASVEDGGVRISTRSEVVEIPAHLVEMVAAAIRQYGADDTVRVRSEELAWSNEAPTPDR